MGDLRRGGLLAIDFQAEAGPLQLDAAQSVARHLIDEIPYSADILADADNLVFNSYPIE